jgi:hypothetical protein
MKTLNPEPPFVWPEPRVIEEISTYQSQPPFEELAVESQSLFGMVSVLTGRGVDVLKTWLDRDPSFKASLIVTVYPTCVTRHDDLSKLLQLVENTSGRLSVHIRPLERIADRATNVLCFLTRSSEHVHVVIGPSEDLGLDSRQVAQVNLAFRADPALVESLKRYFDWLWANSRAITATGVTQIPDLVVPEGTEEGSRLWRNYLMACVNTTRAECSHDSDVEILAEMSKPVAHVDPETGNVTILSNDGQEVTSPTAKLGLPSLDPLAENMARLYAKGSLVSIDKLSRIPPLDTPVHPSIFGDEAEMHRGNVTRRVLTRVSAIDDNTLKEIEKRRKGISPLLAKFSFALADNLRWMPSSARELFELELKRVNEEGLKLVSNLLGGDVESFLKSRRAGLITNINNVYAELGGTGQVSEDVINEVVDSLKLRLCKAQCANFMPKLSYSSISFGRTENAFISPWGQAYSLLSQVATFPRKVLTDNFFLQGLKVAEEDLIEAMNVGNDILCRSIHSRGVKGRCKAELDLLSEIKTALVDSRDRCVLVSRILAGDSVDLIHKQLREVETLASETTPADNEGNNESVQ